MLLRTALWRGLLLLFGWWALTGGDLSGFAFGVCVVVLATLASVVSSPPSATRTRVRPAAIAVLVAAFVLGSVRGGWDVAKRALSPRVKLSPTLIRYFMCLERGPARDVFTTMVALMPGTFPAGVDGRELLVHVLFARPEAAREELEQLEARVAAAFGLQRSDAAHA